MFNVVCKSLITQFSKNFWRTLNYIITSKLMDVYLRRTVILKLPFARRPLDGFGALYKTVSRPRKGRSMTGIIRWCSYNTRTINRIVEVLRFPDNVYKAFRWRHAWVVWTVQRENCHAISFSYENHANIMRKGNTCISCEFHVKIMRLSCDFRNYYNLLYISHISELHLFLFQLSPRSKHYSSVCDFSQFLPWNIPMERHAKELLQDYFRRA